MNRKIHTAWALFLLFVCASPQVWAVPAFTKHADVALSSGAPQSVVDIPDGKRLYFIRDYVVRSATSTNGIDWTEEPGVRLSSAFPIIGRASAPITGCTVLPGNSSGFVMFFSVGWSTGPFGIFRTTSTDGQTWTTTSLSTSAFISTGGTYLGSPRAVQRLNGDWLLYYVQNKNGASNPADQAIFHRRSTDAGVSWTTSTLTLDTRVGDIAVSTRTDNRIRLLFTAPLTGSATNSVLISALGNDAGTDFSIESNTARLSTAAADGGLFSPVVFRSSDTYRHIILYQSGPTGTAVLADAFSAVTAHPDPQGFDKTDVYPTDPDATLILNGEIFSFNPTVRLTMGAVVIPGIFQSRTSDQALSATFATEGAQFGLYSVEVTNDDGQIGVLDGALNVTFAPGRVNLIDNLIKPGVDATSITISIFTTGHVTAKIYTIDGRLVDTVVNGSVSPGAAPIDWAGTNSEGKPVVSGTYLLVTEGPKLNDTKKIVVIR